MASCVKRKVWLLVVVVLVLLSVVAQLVAGGLPSMVQLTCEEGRHYSVGLYSICTSNSSDTVWLPWHPDVSCSLMRKHQELVPSWISGTHILALSATIASCLCLLLLCCFVRAPASLSLSIADGLAALCLTPAALYTAGMLNLSSGISLPSSLESLLPDDHSCARGQVRYAYGASVTAAAIALMVLAGVTCLLSRLMEDKTSALAEYQQYLNDHIISSISDAYTAGGGGGGRGGGEDSSQVSDVMQRKPRQEISETPGDVTYRRRSAAASTSMGLSCSSLM